MPKSFTMTRRIGGPEDFRRQEQMVELLQRAMREHTLGEERSGDMSLWVAALIDCAAVKIAGCPDPERQDLIVLYETRLRDHANELGQLAELARRGNR